MPVAKEPRKGHQAAPSHGWQGISEANQLKYLIVFMVVVAIQMMLPRQWNWWIQALIAVPIAVITSTIIIAMLGF